MKQLWFRIMPVLLALGIGFAWIGTQNDNPPPVNTGSALPEAKSSENSLGIPAVRTEISTDPAKAPRVYFESDQLLGQVVDQDENGLAGIEVRLRTLRRSSRGFFVRTATTDLMGNFVLEDLDPDGVYMLSTDASDGYPGYRLDGFTLDSLATPFKISLTPLALIEISGTVVDAEHVPVANFTLTIDSLDHNYPARTVTSDASGYFRLKSFPAGKLKFYTASKDYHRILGLQATPNHYRNLTLVIDHGQYRLEGRVLDPKGLPIASTRITLTSEISGNEYRSQAFRTRHTDVMGRFVFSDLSGITQTLGVYATGYKPHIEYHNFQNYSDQVEIQLLY